MCNLINTHTRTHAHAKTFSPALIKLQNTTQLKKAEALRLQDEKTRQLFVTAAAALREGGTLLLAHQIRYDMKEILAFMEKVK